MTSKANVVLGGFGVIIGVTSLAVPSFALFWPTHSESGAVAPTQTAQMPTSVEVVSSIDEVTPVLLTAIRTLDAELEEVEDKPQALVPTDQWLPKEELRSERTQVLRQFYDAVQTDAEKKFLNGEYTVRTNTGIDNFFPTEAIVVCRLGSNGEYQRVVLRESDHDFIYALQARAEWLRRQIETSVEAP